jgi:signal transduction histidine kinase
VGVGALALALLVAAGVLQIGLSPGPGGGGPQWGAILRHKGVYLLLALPVVPLAALVRRLVPPGRAGWWPHALAQGAALALFAALHTAAVKPVELAVFRQYVAFGSPTALALGGLVLFATAIAVATLVETQASLRRREAHAAQLEARLAEARLQALAHQLHPHFLFNTLTMIAVLVHRDPHAADAMLTRLADLLRAALRRPAGQEVRLADELATLADYLEIARMRFGARLTIVEATPAELGDHLVPSFLLQPLVENALEHGIARRGGPGTVVLRAERRDGRLRLEVSDDGPGLAAAGDDIDGIGLGNRAEGEVGGTHGRVLGHGVGLANTRRRLEQLYGGAASLVLEPVPGGGARAVVELPARRATEGAA